MNYNSLYKWLERQSSNIKISTHSVYFKINGNIVRYSNHFSNTSKYDVSIVKSDILYIITFPSYKVPIVRSKLCDVKTFLSPIFIMWKATHAEESDDIPEIKEALEKKEEVVKENKNPDVKTATFNTDLEIVQDLINEKALQSCGEKLKFKIVNFVMDHPKSVPNFIDMVRKYGNKPGIRETLTGRIIEQYKNI